MNSIQDYLVEKCGMNEFFAMQLIERLKTHRDIFNEFVDYVRTGEYKDGAKSGEWTAKKLSEELPHLEPQTIFEFLIGLRDEPETYEKYIADGARYL